MGFNFEYEIKDFGNIDYAKIDVKPLTIIAGKNSTGKTFITKSLYAILNTVNINHFYNESKKSLLALEDIYHSFVENVLEKRIAEIEKSFILDFNNNMEYFGKLIETCKKRTIEEQKKLLEKEKNKLLKIKNETVDFINSRKDLQKFKNKEEITSEFTNALIALFDNLTEYTSVIADSISEVLKNHLKQNFQVIDTDNLLKFNSKKTSLHISSIGEITLSKNSPLTFSFSLLGITEIQKLSNVVFFDSPIYTRIRKALTKSKNRFSFLNFIDDEDNYLKGYPEYIDDLFEHLDKEYIDEPMFKDLSEKIGQLINGKLTVKKTSEIVYTDLNGNDIPLSLTAMGIGNIGVIDILLRNNTIKKGSFLILDEPEVHLHPTWQVELARILFDIAKRGVNIILATHSIDLIKAFQVVFTQNNREAEDIIAINKMPYSKEFYELDGEARINEILDDLSEAYYDLYLNKSL